MNLFDTSKSDYVSNENKICIYNTLVEAAILTDFDKFEEIRTKMIADTEEEYRIWGGKRGFMKYLKKLLKQADKHFKKNPKTVTLTNPKYQDFCDDIILYEAIKFAVTGEQINAGKAEEIPAIQTTCNALMEGPLTPAPSIQ